MGTNEQTLAKNTVMLYVMQISGYVFPLLSFPYLTRILGAEKYGVVVFANSIMTYFMLFIEFGFLLSGTNSCSLAADDKEQLGRITFGIIQAKCFLALPAAAILVAGCLFVQKMRQDSLFFALSFFGIFLTAFLPDFLFRGIEKMGVITYRVIVSKAVYTAAIFLFVRKEDDYFIIPIATIGANLFAVVLTWIEIIRKKMITFFFVPAKDMFVRLKESSLFFLSRIATTFYTSLNTVILGFNFPEASVGQYGAANTIANTCRSLMSPVSDSIYPYMVKQKNFALVRKILFVLEPIVIACCVLLWIAAPRAVQIACGNDYDAAIPMLRAMIPIIAITLPAYLCGYPILGAMGQIKWANLSVVISASFHVAGLVILAAAGQVGFIQIIALTCCTQFLELGIRIFVIARSANR
ncbi:MAG: oligosaccharide flippase family protein [Prevotella sp.]|nr:oligosaccharide flippase family protein [Prevotella sp.]